MKAAFGAMLESVHGREYIKQKDSYKPSFTSPWFVARDRFFVSAGAEIPHADSHYDYCLYFKTGNGETTAKLVKAELSLRAGRHWIACSTAPTGRFTACCQAAIKKRSSRKNEPG